MAVMLGSSPVSLYLGSTAITSVFLGSIQVDDDEPVEPPLFTRTASTSATRSIHSGHSLTDAYAYGNGWPGDLVRLRNSLMDPDDSGDTYVVRSTIPGSPMSWRWQNPTDIDAREDIGNFDALMITEAGPPPRVTSEGMVDTLDYLCRFTANTIENGAGNEVILWSIWPALNGPGTSVENPIPSGDWAGYTFRTGLPEYENSFKYMADYATWKMHQLYPSLPEDWRVWLIPGHKWMERVYDDIQLDLVPGITDIAQLFADDIHPEDRAAYGLSCFAFTSMYQVDLREQTGVYVPDGMATALRDYFWQIAWELATEYEPVGMGGTEGAALWWQPSDGDPMPNWTLSDPNTGGGGGDPDPDPEPGDLPEFVFTASADDLTDLTGMTGTQPTVEDGVLKFEGGEALDGDMTLGDRYLVISFMIPGTLPQSSGPAIVGFRAIDTPVWNDHGPISAVYNGFLGRFEITLADVGSDTSDSASADTWYTLEIWTDTEGLHGVVDGVDSMSVSGEIPETVSVRLFPEGALVCHVAAIGLCDHVPTPEERAAARVWAQAEIPE